jgi:hypothetical protein
MHEDVEKARLAANEAFREMYANPGQETRKAWRSAANEYSRVRTALDPDFAAKRAEASRKSREKRKRKKASQTQDDG